MKNLYMIVNPHGGLKRGLNILRKVKPIFKESDIKLHIKETEYVNHAYEYSNTLDFKNMDGLCAIGGDGTMHEIINGMLKRDDKKTLPIGLITGGTGNSFMHDLNCLDPVLAAKKIVKNSLRPIDIAEVKYGQKNKIIYSFNIVGWGVATDANARAEKMRWLGEFRYNVAAIIEVLKGSKRLAKFSYDENTEKNDFVFILACNTIHTGKGMKAAPNAKLDDGLIDLVIVKKTSRLKLLLLFPKIFSGKHISSPLVQYQQVNSFSIFPESDSGLNIDGELIGNTPLSVTVKPGLIKVLV